MPRRLLLILTLGALAGILLLPLNPVNSKLLKLAFLACIAGAWAGFTVLTWRRRPVRAVALALPLLAAIPYLLPGGPIDARELRDDYVKRLAAFEGTTYHWGGESARGIDCSGLPRRALRDALLSYGLRHGHGGAFRSHLGQWWHDASAQALAAGHRGYTVPLGPAGTIREMTYAGLLPGDLAVTTNGLHILAYAGGDRWTQACPAAGEVTTAPGRTGDSLWFTMPVTTHRWQILAGPDGDDGSGQP